MGFFSALGGLGSLAAGLFGNDEGSPGYSNSQETTYSGYNALPQQGKQAWDNFFGMLNDLAARSGNFPELNQTQQNALGQYANPDYSMQGLAPYMNPFQEMIQKQAESAINRGYDMDRSRMMDRSSQLGSRINPATNSALNTQLGQLGESKNRALGDSAANLGYQGYSQALGLRDNTLASMLQAGNTIQQAPYNKVGMYGNLASMMPQSTMGSSSRSQMDATPARQNMMGRLGGFGQMLGGLGGGNNNRGFDPFNGYGPQQAPNMSGGFANNGFGNYMNNFKNNFNGLGGMFGFGG
jgi:hypothetical protein